MKQFIILAFSLFSFLPSVSAKTIGSFPDGTMSIPPSSTPQSKIFLTEWWGHTSNGTSIGGSDLLFWDGGPWATLVLYSARIFVTLPNEPALTGDATLTTVYGKVLDTGIISGFDPGGTEFTPTSPETHRGASGNLYTSFLHDAITSSALPAYLPGFDLSPFDVSSNSIYHVFKTTVPAFEIAATVPEPSIGAVSLLGFSCLLWMSRRKH
ncbi:hypothetical protein [Microcystis aeruginosa]|jgi:hypothetical protein|uniref:PEP-CTERM sorting domain-containing protein n=1 Tax=Microcystis aeruginosa Ma_QC_C_20070703_M131 TaxID=2486263 RepID=A0A551XYT8_MICAE|nr:hypothetical protein [Microcystis aeruginosa]MDB9393719.1 hypothetical protein [Microcystis aeruginosa CS-579]TRT53885.1 MAG: hypothetical protein EWV85_13070 [Microcystis aeruginosa Ma_QC_C_20070703_M131]